MDASQQSAASASGQPVITTVTVPSGTPSTGPGGPELGPGMAAASGTSPDHMRTTADGNASGSGIGNTANGGAVPASTGYQRGGASVNGGVPKRRPRRVDERDRKRAVRACDECRRQKEKCEGGIPCQRCARLNRSCGFTGQPSRDVDYTASRNVSREPTETTQRLRYMEKLLTHFTGRSNLDATTLKNLADAVDRQRGEARFGQDAGGAADDGSQSSEYLGVDAENFTVQPLESNIAHYSGEFSHWNFSMRIKQWIENCNKEYRGGEQPADPLTFKEYYRAEELQSPSNTVMSLSSLPPPYITGYLVDAFFKHAESNYFFVERSWLMDKINLAYENPGVFTHRDVGTVGMILIILAIGTQYAYLDNEGERLTRLGKSMHPSEGSPYEEDAVGVMFYQRACMLVPDIITIASLESVQACLLIGLYTLPLDASGLSYIYLNLALKLAIQNGMHRNYSTNAWPAVIRETRNRVFWTVHAIERRVGIFHGRPLSIAPSEVDATLPSLDPSVWPVDLPANTAHMLATLQLNKTLTKVCREIQLLKTGTRQEAAEVFNRLIETKNDLHKWWDILPTNKFNKDFSGAISFTRSDAHLRLEYCLLRMYAGRPFVFPRGLGRYNNVAATEASPSTSGATPTSSASTSKTHPRALLVTDCIEAALGIIETCKALDKTIGLARASYTEFSACRAALLVIVTQCLQKRTDRLRDALREGMVMIKSMAAWGESARSEVSLLEVFECAVDKLDTAASGNGNGAGSNGIMTDEESGYERFKKWQMLWKQPSSGAPTTTASAMGGGGPESTRMEDDDGDSIALSSATGAGHPEPNGPPHGMPAGVGGGGIGGPIPPHPLEFWRGALTRQEPASTAMQMPSTFFGTDETFASFQQTLDEYSMSMQAGFSPLMDGAGQTPGSGLGGNVWMNM
ncbi:hypothetical protein Cpir12675_006504 [Ceratocystis pirilliformis]|uniref:Zn(2)-C6 fungal-type domain-containing protein n=1 Tax=Ceratocystis pirilliformis TaxID=259994 RepID=A0ABR3YGV2_9PEZI